MIIYLAYLEHDCGCRDTTIVGAFYDEEEAGEFANEQLKLPKNEYFTHCGVQEIEVK